MRQIVIIINGRGGVGKDTICDIVAKHHTAIKVSTITDVKKAAEYLGWEHGKEPKDRAFLSALKDLSTKYYNHPFKAAVAEYNAFVYLKRCEVLFVHVREPEEIRKLRMYIKKDGRADVYTLLIRSKRGAKEYGNHADDCVEEYGYDFYFDNDCGLEELDEVFMKKWKEWLG